MKKLIALIFVCGLFGQIQEVAFTNQRGVVSKNLIVGTNYSQYMRVAEAFTNAGRTNIRREFQATPEAMLYLFQMVEQLRAEIFKLTNK